MHRLICLLLVIGVVGFPKASSAQSSDSVWNAIYDNQPKQEVCGRYHITLVSGERMKNATACWSVGEDDRIRINWKGKVLVVSKSEIREQKYSPTFWEKFKDKAVCTLRIPLIPIYIIMYYIYCGNHEC